MPVITLHKEVSDYCNRNSIQYFLGPDSYQNQADIEKADGIYLFLNQTTTNANPSVPYEVITAIILLCKLGNAGDNYSKKYEDNIQKLEIEIRKFNDYFSQCNTHNRIDTISWNLVSNKFANNYDGIQATITFRAYNHIN